MKEIGDGGLLGDLRLQEHASSSGEAPDLSLLSDKLMSIANQLRRAAPDQVARRSSQLSLAPAQRAELPPVQHFDDAAQQRLINAEQARQMYTTRRKRASIFGNPELFGEPAWDILLDLYIAYVEEKPVSVSSACIGSAAPPTTGLRWLGVLAEQDLILREHDPEDQRRVLVRLTETGLQAMDEFFAVALS